MFPVEAFQVTVSRFVDILRQDSIRFHLTGGITSVAWGEPRMTQDIDLVIDNAATAQNLESFLDAIQASPFMSDESSIRKAVTNHGMFQLFDSDECLKLDVYVREMIPGELDRSVMVSVFEGVELPIVSRADAAVSKLVWVSKGSHKSRRDFRKIFNGSSGEDQAAIRRLAEQLELEELADTLLSEPDEID